MSKAKKILLVLFLLPIAVKIFVMAVNDVYAVMAEQKLKQLPLPEDTVYVESFSKAGKLAGNGNGMQYLGVMLITSELPLEQLKDYYGQYDYCFVYEQDTAKIEHLHGRLSFRTDPVPENAYMVELWGDEPAWFFVDFDIRGH